jgi:hypothetical protein
MLVLLTSTRMIAPFVSSKNLNVLYRQSGQWSVTGGKEVGVDDFCFALAAAILEASKEDDLHWLESLVR